MDTAADWITRRPGLSTALTGTAAAAVLAMFLPTATGWVAAFTAGVLVAAGAGRDERRRLRGERHDADHEIGRLRAQLAEANNRPFVEGPTKALTSIGDLGETT